MTERTLTTKKGMSVTTTLTDVEAVKILATKGKGKFALDLVKKHEKYGLSPDQMAWAHKLAIEIQEGKAPAAKAKPEGESGYSEIVMMLVSARDGGLQWPKIRLSASKHIVLSLTGSGAKVPGSVNVTDGRPYGENTYFGRIAPDGEFFATNAGKGAVRDALKAFATDPAATATLYGQKTGRCCFCGRELTTKESVTVGYGPICACKFGLPWGHVAETTKVEEAVSAAPHASEAETAIAESMAKMATDAGEEVVATTPEELEWFTEMGYENVTLKG